MRWVLLIFTPVAALWAQSAAQLAPHSTLSQQLAGNEERIYRLDVPAGQTVNVSIREKQGLAGILILTQNGREVAEADLAKRISAAKRILVGPGEARLKVIPANHSPVTRIFDLSVGDFRPAADHDRLRFSAEQLMGAGEAILRRFQPNYLDDSLAKFQAALQLWKQTGDRAAQADAFDHIGYVLHFKGEMKAALEAYQQALDLSKADGDQSGAAAAFYGLAHTYHDTAQYAKASELAKQALDLDRALDNPRGEADALMVLGLGFLAKGDNGSARTNFEEMLAASQKAGDRIRESDAENDLGLLEFQLGNFTESQRLYSQALEIEHQENDPVRVAQEVNNLGTLYFSTGDLRQALRYQEEALPIRKTLAQPGSYANTLYNVALDHFSLGEYQQALDGFDAALPIFRRVSHRPGEGYTLQQQGRIFMWLGENAKAEVLLKQSLAIRRSISDRRGEVLTLNLLGDLHLREQRDSEALQEQREALSISQTAGYQREEAQTLSYLAEVLLQTGETRPSLDMSAKSLELARKVGDKLSEASALHLEGKAWTRLRETEPAKEALEQALAIQRETGARAFEADTRLDLAKLDISQGFLSQAAGDLAGALDLVESMRSNFDNRQSRLQVARSHRSFYELAIDVQMRLHDPAKAFEISERARARGLLDLITEARLDVRQGVDPELLAREREVQELLDAKHDRLMRLLSTNHSAALETEERREVDELLSRYQAVEAEIRAKSPQYAALTQPGALSVSAVQALLPDSGTSLIEFWLGEKRSYVWVVSKTECRGFALPPRAEVETLARRAYQALNARNENREETLAQREQRLGAARVEFTRTAALLSSQLLSPIGRGLDAHRWWIVADGALAYLPFAALPVPGTATPLVKEHEIIGLPSASVLAALREEDARRRPPDRLVAVFADPVFRADDSRVTGSKAAAVDKTITRAAADSGIADLPRLYFSRQEADAIRKLAPPHQTFIALDFDASRAEAKKPELGRYRVLHFATHGLLDSRNPELSGIVLSMVDRKGNPEDGFLRLHEIYNLKLNADLVVLSGCQTALGEEVRSEGLIGLTRGFMYAGAPQVMASLWSVRDRAIAELMRRFYEGLLRRHLTPAAALRSAQLAMMQDSRWSDPYYWAAFTLQGSR
ncbi:MAG TPA: CHAT domain-containing tetratricopeptide repeat protein [Bryobacteraceae bacterium]|nr:CHAT domain-containing tetratricopeptide repeat protein [Bryobacteraceae bacterium]